MPHTTYPTTSTNGRVKQTTKVTTPTTNSGSPELTLARGQSRHAYSTRVPSRIWTELVAK